MWINIYERKYLYIIYIVINLIISKDFKQIKNVLLKTIIV